MKYQGQVAAPGLVDLKRSGGESRTWRPHTANSIRRGKMAEKVTVQLNCIDLETLGNYAARARANPQEVTLLTRARALWKREMGSPSFQGPTRLSTGEKFVMEADLPGVFFGPGQTPHKPLPVQQELFGMATCLAGAILLLGAQRGLDLEEVAVTVETDVNFTRLLTENEELPPAGPLRVRIEARPNDPQTLAALLEIGERAKRCAPGVYMIANPMPIAIEVAGIQ
jgi:uncharacterized OsmC-like protein